MTVFFGKTPEGQDVTRCEIRNGGAVANIISWGAALQDFRLEDRELGLVLGGSDMAAYLGPMRYFGAIVGPVANRIAGGRMTVAGTNFELDKNEAGRTTLHSGIAGFSDRNWSFANVTTSSCRLSLTHPDGLGGFPGNIDVGVTYRLGDDGALDIEITGETDAATFFSPAFHGYWNLSGQPDLADHRLLVNAASYLPVDEGLIPLGTPETVSNTSFDYLASRSIGALLDHNFCLAPGQGRMQPACQLDAAGLRLVVETDQPGVQIYNGAHIDTGTAVGHAGKPYGRFAGLAIEPQFWPDTPHQPSYPSSMLLPGTASRHLSRFHVRYLK